MISSAHNNNMMRLWWQSAGYFNEGHVHYAHMKWQHAAAPVVHTHVGHVAPLQGDQVLLEERIQTREVPSPQLQIDKEMRNLFPSYSYIQHH